jgi:hypothetical protein
MNRPRPQPLLRAAVLALVVSALAGGTLELHRPGEGGVHGPYESGPIAVAANHPANAWHFEASPLEQRERCDACLIALGMRSSLAPSQSAAPPQRGRALVAEHGLPPLAAAGGATPGRGPPLS